MSSTKESQNVLNWSNTVELIDNLRVDEVGLKERVASLATRSIKKDSKLQALNYIVSMCDLTTLEGEDTEGKIGQMTAKAIRPDPSNNDVPSVAAVCVYPALVSKAKEMTINSNVKVASVSSYFPVDKLHSNQKYLIPSSQLIKVLTKLILL